jgi:hypothetical protein
MKPEEMSLSFRVLEHESREELPRHVYQRQAEIARMNRHRFWIWAYRWRRRQRRIIALGWWVFIFGMMLLLWLAAR